MTLFDRYLLRLFSKIFMICFISFTGLYFVIHMFTNLDELSAIATTTDQGMMKLMVSFYGPATLELFDNMSGVLVLTSAIFAVTWIQRKRELTAIEASGITKARVVRPIIVAAVIILIASFANRELAIPQFKHQLGRSIQDWTAQGTVPFSSHRDMASGMMIRGNQLNLSDQTLSEVTFELPLRLTQDYKQVQGRLATYCPANDQHPAGMLVDGVQKPKKFGQARSVPQVGETLVFASRDYSWLKRNQMFVACKLDLEEIAYGRQMARYSSIGEMIGTLNQPNRRFGFGDQVAIHGRILQPVLDLTLLLLGLPLVISKPNQNIFYAAASCMLIVVAVELATMVSHTLGAYSMIQPAVLSAWLPVFLFVPLVPLALGKLK